MLPLVWCSLTRALAGGALPLLEVFHVIQNNVTDDDLNLVADMVETRTHIPGCRGLKEFYTNDWLHRASAVTGSRLRLLRALLPSLKISPSCTWNDVLEPCFRDVPPLFLETLGITIAPDEAFPSVEVLEAAPALKCIRYWIENDDYDDDFDDYFDAAAFQPITAVLRGGVGLRNLEEVFVISCALGDVGFSDFLLALKGSGIAERMVELTFSNCQIGAEGVRALGDLFRRDGLPSLKALHLSDDRLIWDEGVVALAGGLREAPRTMLSVLKLRT